MKSFYCFILSLYVVTLVACQKGEHKNLNPDVIPTPGTSTPTPAPSPSGAQQGTSQEGTKDGSTRGGGSMVGPSDGGGGDTCNGKMIESYRVDITTLEEYKTYIQPILKKLTVSDENGESSPFDLSAKLKNWYLIDCKLQDLPKKRKGLYLETYQTAIHTSREIFIDSKSYNKMSAEEKSKLLLHEMIMGFYLTKFLTVQEVCQSSNRCLGDMAKYTHWNIFKPEPYHPLNEDDHQRIRNVTAWILENKETVTPEKFVDLIKKNNFDKRFASVPRKSSDPSAFVEVDVQQLIRMLKKYQWSKTLPSFCQFDPQSYVSMSTCASEIQVSYEDYKEVSNAVLKQLKIKIKIIRQSDQKVFVRNFMLPINTNTSKIKMSLSHIGDIMQSSSWLLFSNWPWSFDKDVELKEGAESHVLLFMLNIADVNNIEIYQIISQKLIWSSFEEVEEVVNGIPSLVTYGYPVADFSQSETLFVEKDLPFSFSLFSGHKTVIRSKPKVPVKQ